MSKNIDGDNWDNYFPLSKETPELHTRLRQLCAEGAIKEWAISSSFLFLTLPDHLLGRGLQ